MTMQITKGFKYRLYLNKEQQKQLNHCCFIYNQAYNICLDLQNEIWENNKDKPKEERIYLKSFSMYKNPLASNEFSILIGTVLFLFLYIVSIV